MDNIPGQSSGSVCATLEFLLYEVLYWLSIQSDSLLQGVRPGQCYSALVNRTPSGASPDGDIVTLPPDMARNNLIKIRTTVRRRKGKIKIELNAIFLKSARAASSFHLTSCPGKCGDRAQTQGYSESAEPMVMNIHEVSEQVRGWHAG